MAASWPAPHLDPPAPSARAGTPLQNNTTELWALLSILEPDLFPSLADFLAEYGTLVNADQVDALQPLGRMRASTCVVAPCALHLWLCVLVAACN